MADYEANPQVTTPGTIRLYGNEYKLKNEEDGSAGEVKVIMSTVFPPKIVSGTDIGPNDNPTMSTQEWTDLRGGMGLWKWRGPEDNNRYFAGDNIDCLFPKAITLGPLVTKTNAPVNTSIRSIGELNGTLVIVQGGGQVYNFDGTSFSALIDTLPTTSVSNARFNSRLFHSLGSSGYSFQAAPDAVATDVATPTAQTFTVWDGKIYTLDTSLILYSSTTGSAASWTTLATIPLPNNPSLIVQLVTYDDADGNPVIWALTSLGPWLYDAVNNKWMQARFDYPYYAIGNNHQFYFGAKYRESLFNRAGDLEVYKLTMSDGLLNIKPVFVDSPDMVSADYDGGLGSFTSTNEFLFATIGSTSLAGGNTKWGMLLYNGGWHPIYLNANTSGSVNTPESAYITSSSNHPYRLYFHMDAGADPSSLAYIKLGELRKSPLSGVTKNYSSSGTLELPCFGGGYESQSKTARQVRIKLAGASSTETVQIAYRLNGSTGAYTNLGSAVTANTEQTLKFGTNSVGLSFKSIQLKLTFVRGGTTTAAPKLEYTALDYIRLPEVLRGFLVNIDCSALVGGNTPRQQVDNLWTAIETDTFGTFAFRDDSATGSNNTRSYLVKVTRPEGMEDTGLTEGGVYKLLLISYGDN